MGAGLLTATLESRAVIVIEGEDWRSFLQGLVTQDVETLRPGEIRFAALLTPQGRLQFDLFIVGSAHACLIDCAASHRESLIGRLGLYRLRAKVQIAASAAEVRALWGSDFAPDGWLTDPRAKALGFRSYAAAAPREATPVLESRYDRHRLSLGVPGSADWEGETTYPIEANFDLLGGIDFHKGCFVGQETTSRMKRRGNIKSRMAPIVFAGAPPARGSELLAGALRAGEALSGFDGEAMALLRLDRLEAGPRSLTDGRAWAPRLPSWIGEIPSLKS